MRFGPIPPLYSTEHTLHAGRLHLLFFRLFNKHDPASARSFITLQWQQRQHGSLHVAARHVMFSFLDINYCPKPTCLLFPPKTEVMKRCFRFACKQWTGTVLKYSSGDSLLRNGAEQLVHTVTKREAGVSVGDWGTPHCFFYIYFNSLKNEWTSFKIHPR